MVIIVTTVFGRTLVKYGKRGWRYICFEAGHLAQNVHLVTTASGLKSCAIGGFLDEKVIELLDLDENSEIPLYLLSVGD